MMILCGCRRKQIIIFAQASIHMWAAVHKVYNYYCHNNNAVQEAKEEKNTIDIRFSTIV